MPNLKMFIDGMFIDQAQLDYTGLHAVAEKEDHQRNVMSELFRKNIDKVSLFRKVEPEVDPLFYIEGVHSKVNDYLAQTSNYD